MQGKILDYTINTGEGYISGDDGQRYNFKISEWMSHNAYPHKACGVDFVIEDANAVKIYSTSAKPFSHETSSAAIVSLVFGIIAVMFTWWLLMIPSLIAIITGHVARVRIKSSKGTLGGDGLALGGLILGYFSFAIYLIMMVFFVGLIGSLSR